MTRRYPAYWDSGVEWLGEVPAGWALSPLKHVADFVNGAAFKPDTWSEEGTPIIRIENLNGGIDFNCFDGEINERYLVNQGDILFGWSGNRGTSFGPFIWGHPGRFYLNQHIFNVRGFTCDRKWFYWCLRAATYYVEQKAHGIIGMVHITKGDLGAINIPLPSRDEQTAIAAFLDRETAKIDALVAEQRRLIDLLKEKRQAVISHAVTRGLNPAARLKPSGVDWLGDVPEGWEVVPLRYLIDFIESGTSVNATDTPASGDELGVLKTSCVYTGNFEPTENKAVVPEEYDRTSCPLRSGSLIVSRMNTPDLVGAAGYVAEAFANIFLPDRLWQVVMTRANAEFVHFWTMTDFYRGQVRAVCAGTSSSMQNLSQDAFKAFLIAVPPVEEQTSIVQSLKRQTVQLDALSEIARSAINLLQERRAALISAAVTGKIDVRDLFPQETEAA